MSPIAATEAIENAVQLWREAIALSFADCGITPDFTSDAHFVVSICSQLTDPPISLNARRRICLPSRYSVRMSGAHGLMRLLSTPSLFIILPVTVQRAILDVLIIVVEREPADLLRLHCISQTHTITANAILTAIHMAQLATKQVHCTTLPVIPTSTPQINVSRQSSSTTYASASSTAAATTPQQLGLSSAAAAALASRYHLPSIGYPSPIVSTTLPTILLDLLPYTLSTLSISKRMLHLLGVGLSVVATSQSLSTLIRFASVPSELSVSTLQALTLAFRNDSAAVAKAAPRALFSFGGMGAGLQTLTAAFPFTKEYGIAFWFRVDQFPTARGSYENGNGGLDANGAFDFLSQNISHLAAWVNPAGRGMDLYFDAAGVLSLAISTSGNSGSTSGSSGSILGSSGNSAPLIFHLNSSPLRRGVWYHLTLKHSKPKGFFGSDELSVAVDNVVVSQESIRFPFLGALIDTEWYFGWHLNGQMGPITVFHEMPPPAAMIVLARMEAGKGGSDAAAVAAAMSSMTSLGTGGSGGGGAGTSGSGVVSNSDAEDVPPAVDLLRGVLGTDRRWHTIQSRVAIAFHPSRVFNPASTSGGDTSSLWYALDVHGGRHAVIHGRTQAWVLNHPRALLSTTGGVAALLPLWPRLLADGEVDGYQALQSAKAMALERKDEQALASIHRRWGDGLGTSLAETLDDEDRKTSSIGCMLCDNAGATNSYIGEDILDSQHLSRLTERRESFSGEGAISALISLITSLIHSSQSTSLILQGDGVIELIVYTLRCTPRALIQAEGNICVLNLVRLRQASRILPALEVSVLKHLVGNLTLWVELGANYQFLSALLSVLLGGMVSMPRILLASVGGISGWLEAMDELSPLSEDGSYENFKTNASTTRDNKTSFEEEADTCNKDSNAEDSASVKSPPAGISSPKVTIYSVPTSPLAEDDKSLGRPLSSVRAKSFRFALSAVLAEASLDSDDESNPLENKLKQSPKHQELSLLSNAPISLASPLALLLPSVNILTPNSSTSPSIHDQVSEEVLFDVQTAAEYTSRRLALLTVNSERATLRRQICALLIISLRHSTVPLPVSPGTTNDTTSATNTCTSAAGASGSTSSVGASIGNVSTSGGLLNLPLSASNVEADVASLLDRIVQHNRIRHSLKVTEELIAVLFHLLTATGPPSNLLSSSLASATNVPNVSPLLSTSIISAIGSPIHPAVINAGITNGLPYSFLSLLSSGDAEDESIVSSVQNITASNLTAAATTEASATTAGVATETVPSAASAASIVTTTLMDGANMSHGGTSFSNVTIHAHFFATLIVAAGGFDALTGLIAKSLCSSLEEKIRISGLQLLVVLSSHYDSSLAIAASQAATSAAMGQVGGAWVAMTRDGGRPLVSLTSRRLQDEYSSRVTSFSNTSSAPSLSTPSGTTASSNVGVQTGMQRLSANGVLALVEAGFAKHWKSTGMKTYGAWLDCLFSIKGRPPLNHPIHFAQYSQIVANQEAVEISQCHTTALVAKECLDAMRRSDLQVGESKAVYYLSQWVASKDPQLVVQAVKKAIGSEESLFTNLVRIFNYIDSTPTFNSTSPNGILEFKSFDKNEWDATVAPGVTSFVSRDLQFSMEIGYSSEDEEELASRNSLSQPFRRRRRRQRRVIWDPIVLSAFLRTASLLPSTATTSVLSDLSTVASLNPPAFSQSPEWVSVLVRHILPLMEPPELMTLEIECFGGCSLCKGKPNILEEGNWCGCIEVIRSDILSETISKLADSCINASVNNDCNDKSKSLRNSRNDFLSLSDTAQGIRERTNNDMFANHSTSNSPTSDKSLSSTESETQKDSDAAFSLAQKTFSTVLSEEIHHSLTGEIAVADVLRRILLSTSMLTANTMDFNRTGLQSTSIGHSCDTPPSIDPVLCPESSGLEIDPLLSPCDTENSSFRHGGIQDKDWVRSIALAQCVASDVLLKMIDSVEHSRRSDTLSSAPNVPLHLPSPPSDSLLSSPLWFRNMLGTFNAVSSLVLLGESSASVGLSGVPTAIDRLRVYHHEVLRYLRQRKRIARITRDLQDAVNHWSEQVQILENELSIMKANAGILSSTSSAAFSSHSMTSEEIQIEKSEKLEKARETLERTKNALLIASNRLSDTVVNDSDDLNLMDDENQVLWEVDDDLAQDILTEEEVSTALSSVGGSVARQLLERTESRLAASGHPNLTAVSSGAVGVHPGVGFHTAHPLLNIGKQQSAKESRCCCLLLTCSDCRMSVDNQLMVPQVSFLAIADGRGPSFSRRASVRSGRLRLALMALRFFDALAWPCGGRRLEASAIAILAHTPADTSLPSSPLEAATMRCNLPYGSSNRISSTGESGSLLTSAVRLSLLVLSTLSPTTPASLLAARRLDALYTAMAATAATRGFPPPQFPITPRRSSASSGVASPMLPTAHYPNTGSVDAGTTHISTGVTGSASSASSSSSFIAFSAPNSPVSNDVLSTAIIVDDAWLYSGLAHVTTALQRLSTLLSPSMSILNFDSSVTNTISSATIPNCGPWTEPFSEFDAASTSIDQNAMTVLTESSVFLSRLGNTFRPVKSPPVTAGGGGNGWLVRNAQKRKPNIDDHASSGSGSDIESSFESDIRCAGVICISDTISEENIESASHVFATANALITTLTSLHAVQSRRLSSSLEERSAAALFVVAESVKADIAAALGSASLVLPSVDRCMRCGESVVATSLTSAAACPLCVTVALLSAATDSIYAKLGDLRHHSQLLKINNQTSSKNMDNHTHGKSHELASFGAGHNFALEFAPNETRAEEWRIEIERYGEASFRAGHRAVLVLRWLRLPWLRRNVLRSPLIVAAIETAIVSEGTRGILNDVLSTNSLNPDNIRSSMIPTSRGTDVAFKDPSTSQTANASPFATLASFFRRSTRSSIPPTPPIPSLTPSLERGDEAASTSLPYSPPFSTLSPAKKHEREGKITQPECSVNTEDDNHPAVTIAASGNEISSESNSKPSNDQDSTHNCDLRMRKSIAMYMNTQVHKSPVTSSMSALARITRRIISERYAARRSCRRRRLAVLTRAVASRWGQILSTHETLASPYTAVDSVVSASVSTAIHAAADAVQDNSHVKPWGGQYGNESWGGGEKATADAITAGIKAAQMYTLMLTTDGKVEDSSTENIKEFSIPVAGATPGIAYLGVGSHTDIRGTALLLSTLPYPIDHRHEAYGDAKQSANRRYIDALRRSTVRLSRTGYLSSGKGTALISSTTTDGTQVQTPVETKVLGRGMFSHTPFRMPVIPASIPGSSSQNIITTSGGVSATNTVDIEAIESESDGEEDALAAATALAAASKAKQSRNRSAAAAALAFFGASQTPAIGHTSIKDHSSSSFTYSQRHGWETALGTTVASLRRPYWTAAWYWSEDERVLWTGEVRRIVTGGAVVGSLVLTTRAIFFRHRRREPIFGSDASDDLLRRATPHSSPLNSTQKPTVNNDDTSKNSYEFSYGTATDCQGWDDSRWPLEQLVAVFARRHLIQPSAAEFHFFTSHVIPFGFTTLSTPILGTGSTPSVLFAFSNIQSMADFLAILRTLSLPLLSPAFLQATQTIASLNPALGLGGGSALPNTTSSVPSGSPFSSLILSARKQWESTSWTESWRRRQLSTYDYLLLLNQYAGRSWSDLSQYPVMPWVLAFYPDPSSNEDLNEISNDEDKTSNGKNSQLTKTRTHLDLTAAVTFRRLDRPMGALTDTRRDEAIERYRACEVASTTPYYSPSNPTGLYNASDIPPPFMYGSHYSSAAVVLHFLIRQEPYTSLAIALQSGRFDCPDRLFRSIKRAWCGASNGGSDVKELPPQLYTSPEVLVNYSRLSLGKCLHWEDESDKGEKVDDNMDDESDGESYLERMLAREISPMKSAMSGAYKSSEEHSYESAHDSSTNWWGESGEVSNENLLDDALYETLSQDQTPSVSNLGSPISAHSIVSPLSTPKPRKTELSPSEPSPREGPQVDDVELPSWANGSPFEFIRKHRAALESDAVAAVLPSWIDLVFGFQQRGPAAVQAANVFYFLTYEGAADLSASIVPRATSQQTISPSKVSEAHKLSPSGIASDVGELSTYDLLTIAAAATQVKHFGQTPTQLFTKPHPPRLPLSSTLSTAAALVIADDDPKALAVIRAHESFDQTGDDPIQLAMTTGGGNSSVRGVPYTPQMQFIAATGLLPATITTTPTSSIAATTSLPPRTSRWSQSPSPSTTSTFHRWSNKPSTLHTLSSNPNGTNALNSSTNLLGEPSFGSVVKVATQGDRVWMVLSTGVLVSYRAIYDPSGPHYKDSLQATTLAAAGQSALQLRQGSFRSLSAASTQLASLETLVSRHLIFHTTSSHQNPSNASIIPNATTVMGAAPTSSGTSMIDNSNPSGGWFSNWRTGRGSGQGEARTSLYNAARVEQKLAAARQTQAQTPVLSGMALSASSGGSGAASPLTVISTTSQRTSNASPYVGNTLTSDAYSSKLSSDTIQMTLSPPLPPLPPSLCALAALLATTDRRIGTSPFYSSILESVGETDTFDTTAPILSTLPSRLVSILTVDIHPTTHSTHGSSSTATSGISSTSVGNSTNTATATNVSGITATGNLSSGSNILPGSALGGPRVLSAGYWDGNLRLHSAVDGKELLAVPSGHIGRVTALLTLQTLPQGAWTAAQVPLPPHFMATFGPTATSASQFEGAGASRGIIPSSPTSGASLSPHVCAGVRIAVTGGEDGVLRIWILDLHTLSRGMLQAVIPPTLSALEPVQDSLALALISSHAIAAASTPLAHQVSSMAPVTTPSAGSIGSQSVSPAIISASVAVAAAVTYHAASLFNTAGSVSGPILHPDQTGPLASIPTSVTSSVALTATTAAIQSTPSAVAQNSSSSWLSGNTNNSSNSTTLPSASAVVNIHDLHSNGGNSALVFSHALYGHTSPIVALSHSVELDLLASAGADGMICLHSIRQGPSTPLRIFTTLRRPQTSYGLGVHATTKETSPIIDQLILTSKNYIAVSVCRPTLRIKVFWVNGQHLASYSPSSNVTLFEATPSGDGFICGTSDGCVNILRAWDLSVGYKLTLPPGLTPTTASYNDDFSLLYIGTSDGSIYAIADCASVPTV